MHISEHCLYLRWAWVHIIEALWAPLQMLTPLQMARCVVKSYPW